MQLYKSRRFGDQFAAIYGQSLENLSKTIDNLLMIIYGQFTFML